MKNKKKLLVAVAAMGLLAVGTAGVGTAAWYQTNTAAVTVNSGTAGTTITSTAEATAAAMQVDLVFSISLTDNLEPTLAADGKTYVVQNNKVVVADPQPAETARIGDSATISVTHIYYHGEENEISAEDARGLASTSYDIKLTGGNGNPGVRINSSKTQVAGTATPEDDSDDFYSVTNNGSGVTIGYLTFHALTPEDPSTISFKKASDNSAGLDTFYYAFNPQYAGAAGTTQASSESAGAKEVSVTVTLTAH